MREAFKENKIRFALRSKRKCRFASVYLEHRINAKFCLGKIKKKYIRIDNNCVVLRREGNLFQFVFFFDF